MSICFWGPRRSGKTVFLGMLYISAPYVKYNYGIQPDPRQDSYDMTSAQNYLNDLRDKIFTKQPAGEPQVPHTPVSARDTYRYLFQRQATVGWDGLPAEVTFFDPSGEHFNNISYLLKDKSTRDKNAEYKNSEFAFDYLRNSRALIFFISPSDWDKTGSTDVDHRRRLEATLRCLPVVNSKVKQDIAFVFTMMDDPRNLSSLAGTTDDHDIKTWDDHDIEECMREDTLYGNVTSKKYQDYEKKLRIFATKILQPVGMGLIETHCKEDKYKFFACASYGIYRDKTGKVIKIFNGDNPSTSSLTDPTMIDSTNAIVWEPFRWIANRNYRHRLEIVRQVTGK